MFDGSTILKFYTTNNTINKARKQVTEQVFHSLRIYHISVQITKKLNKQKKKKKMKGRRQRKGVAKNVNRNLTKEKPR